MGLKRLASENIISTISESTHVLVSQTEQIDGRPKEVVRRIACDDLRTAIISDIIGSPLVASTAAGMSDHTRVYVYTGNESGYVFGNWYYYNGSTWVSGGVYNSTAVETDKTLTVSDKAADAKKTGEKIASIENIIEGLADEIGETLQEDIAAIQDAIDGISETGISAVGAASGQVPVADGEGSWTWDDVDSGISAAGASEGQAPIADGNGGWAWGAIPVTQIPAANAPVREMMAIIKSWVGRTDIVHTAGNDFTGMFSNNCVADSNGKYHMDCSDFVSAILLGITFENSRYALGSSAANIENEFLCINKMPQSNATKKSQGGLQTDEMAQWFNSQGRLFEVPRKKEEVVKTLRFGDILFGSNSNNATYYGIEHVMICLGAFKYNDGNGIILAECNSDLSVGQEGTTVRIKVVAIGNNSSYYRVFARPEYKMSLQNSTPFIPSSDGKYKYDPIFLPCTEVVLDDGDYSKAGHVKISQYMASTPWYLPAIPGSTVEYTGSVSSSRGNYLVRVTEYDKNLNRVKRGQTMAYNGAKQPAITLDSATRYVAFSIGYSSSSGNQIWLSDLDDFEVTVTPPQA